MLKKVNTHKSSKFQEFKDSILQTLTKKPIVQDIDLIRLNNGKVKYLIEVKRSKVENWKPYILKNFPERNLSNCDDLNYKALFSLANLMNVPVLVFYCPLGAITTKGIRPFKLINSELDFHPYKFFQLSEIENILKTRYHCENSGDYLSSRRRLLHNQSFVKDFNNPNNKNINEDPYHWFSNNHTARDFYYVESSGMWTMLVSDGASTKPLWLYIELNLDISNIDLEIEKLCFYFKPQIEIHRATGISFSIIAHKEDLESFMVFDFENDNINKHVLNRQQFVKYYISHISV